ncbi:MAG: OPT oligopeptide transporter protein-domain-containing protein [Benniella sp.]|nr:MAG: OPT oligopeptide transporter protein-domain-containing protein [Benniella sp.]
MSDHASEKDSRREDYPSEKKSFEPDEKNRHSDADISLEEEEQENSPIDAVRLAVPLTDDPTLPVVTFRFWIISFLFTALGATVQQYYFFRSTSGTYSIFFVNLISYSMGKAMARILPENKISAFGYGMSLNPGPFNIKEHALIGISVSTGAGAAYAIEILSATDLFLGFRINVLGSLLLIITTQSVGYGMAGMLRRYLVYPAEMVWWSKLVQVAFYNTMHNTDEYKRVRLTRGWSRMKFFWIVAMCTFVYQFLPQWIAPVLVYFDWLCWINPFNMDFWALFSSISGAGIFSLSFDWTSVGGPTMYLPLAAQLCFYGGMILNYWIILPIMWMTNTLGTKTIGRPLTSGLFFEDGKPFSIKDVLNQDFTLNETLYEAGPPANMAPMYALTFLVSFIALAGCCSHVACFHGAEIWRNWKRAVGSEEEDIHTKMMKIYPEVPQLWYAIFYIIMAALACVVCEVYGTQLPWYGLLLALFVGWALTLPIGVMNAITGFGPGLNVITELICGYIWPGKPIANMTFKCYGFMAMVQCNQLMSDLKLGHYMKIPPRSLFVGQIWGTLIGSVFNYLTMILIINSQRDALNGKAPDPNGLWTGQSVQTFWGSGLIYGALGPARMFALDGKYWFVYIGFLIGLIVPVLLWVLSKKFPQYPWSKFNIAIIAGGMSVFPNGYVVGVVSSIVVCLVVQFHMYRYHRNWWNKYVFILSAALDTGAAFTGLVIFLFLGGGISPKLSVQIPSWWGKHYVKDNVQNPNYPFLSVDRCGAAGHNWESGTLTKP